MPAIRTTLAALALALGAGLAAPPADAFPRLTGGAEDSRVEHAPGAQPDSIVGGGRVALRQTDDRLEVAHLDAFAAQPGRRGVVAHIQGGADGQVITWLPQGLPASRLALVGGDGTLPAPAPRSLPAGFASLFGAARG